MKYLNDKGQTVLIAEMPDAYLLNSYAKQKKRLEDIKSKLKDNPSLAVYVSQQVNEIEILVRNLLEEIRNRNLI